MRYFNSKVGAESTTNIAGTYELDKNNKRVHRMIQFLKKDFIRNIWFHRQ